MPLKPIRIAVILLCLLGGGNDGPPPPLGETYPIDGEVDFSAFDTVYELDVDIHANGGQGVIVKTVTLRWAITNDDRNIYFAFEWADNTYDHDFDINLGPQVFDGIKLLFDNDGNGQLESGEDERTVITASIGSYYIDQHVSAGDETDLIGDGFSKLKYDQNTRIYQAEFLFPLTSDAQNEDADPSALTRYSIMLFDQVDLNNQTGNIGYAYGEGDNSATWPNLPLIEAVPHDYPEIPSGLTGLIVFLSDHEEPNREIYSFDPSTAAVTRITVMPALFKENVSLSHDRTRIAFHGSADKVDYASYEIYVADIDGTNLTRLTDNTILDGHPGWSPDDSRIVYASFRDAGQASIIIMDAQTGDEIADLTPLGIDDNDPDYLPDGRIIFKTDRFSVFPELRIALMNDDGSGVLQLTYINDVVDHDPVGDSTHTVFERLLNGINFATDVEALFTPWDIVEAQLDAGGEQTLLSDDWINWLPVYDPSGQYICYLKGTGYSAAYLMTRSGEQLGRFIPNITRLTYIDWK